jgi:hypothetical protein
MWQLAAASVFFAVSLGLFLVARRLAGALTAPRTDVVALTALALVSWAWLVRLSFGRQPSVHRQTLAGELRSPDSVFAIWLPLIATSLFAASCSYPFQRLIDWITWPLVLVAIAFAPRWVIPARRSSPANDSTVRSQTVLQELTRFRLNDGRETVQGTLRAEFAAGERTTTLHIAFCPPFERLPQVQATVLDGPPADVKLVQVLHQGAQLEVRLSVVPTCQQCVTVRLSAKELAAAENSNQSRRSSAP